MDNYFNLPNPEELYCQILQCGGGHHPSLEIKVHFQADNRELYRLSFSLPQYINCFTQWKGAAFRKGNIEDFKAAFSNLANGSHLAEQYARHYEIFTVSVSTDLPQAYVAYIIAAGGKVLDSNKKD